MTSPKHDPLADIAWPKPECPRAEISAAIHQACTKNLCPARRMSAGTRMSLCMLLSGSAAAIGYWFGHEHHRSEVGMRLGVYGAAGWAVLQAAALFIGFSPSSGRRYSRAVRVGLAALLPVLFLAYLTYAAWSYVPFSEFSHGARASHAVSCGLVALLFGTVVGGGIMLAWRGTDPVTPRLSGTLAGLVGGVGGALAVGIGCPSHEAWHLWISHGIVVLALGLMGFGAGRRLLSP